MGWVRCTHDDGRTYYMNAETEKTSWVLPEGLSEADIADYVSSSGSSSDSDSEDDGGSAAAAPADCPWVRCTHDDGRTYYMNEATEKTSWTLPAGFTDAQIADFVSESESGSDSDSEQDGPASAPAAAGPCPWARCTHDDGRTYYMNEETEKTSWTLPAGFTDAQIADFVSESASDSDEEEGVPAAPPARTAADDDGDAPPPPPPSAGKKKKVKGAWEASDSGSGSDDDWGTGSGGKTSGTIDGVVGEDSARLASNADEAAQEMARQKARVAMGEAEAKRQAAKKRAAKAIAKAKQAAADGGKKTKKKKKKKKRLAAPPS